MDFRGIFEDGVVRPTEPVNLPQGSQVECHTVGGAARSDANHFWAGPSLDALADEQGVQPIRALSDVRGDWPAEDAFDDFLQSVKVGRR